MVGDGVGRGNRFEAKIAADDLADARCACVEAAEDQRVGPINPELIAVIKLRERLLVVFATRGTGVVL